MPRSRIAVVTAADDAFALPLAAMLQSVLASARPATGLHLFVVSDGIGARRRARLQTVLDRWVRPRDRVTWIDAAGRLTSETDAALKTSFRISETTYLRLLIPKLLPDRCRRAIYLDADLVVARDLTPLWTLPMEGHAVLAVQDFSIQQLDHPKGVRRHRDLGLRGDAPYFNAGVLVLDLERWRRQGIAGQVFDYLHDYRDDVNEVDQDGLNAVLAGQWKPLDLRWNQQSNVEHLERWPASPLKDAARALGPALLHAPFIVHYTGASKPWHAVCHHPERDRFVQHLKASGWFSAWQRIAWDVLQTARIPEQYLRQYTRPLRHRLRAALTGPPAQ
jgi:lipopolysaccharide biosynthesis glycosyltransferase